MEVSKCLQCFYLPRGINSTIIDIFNYNDWCYEVILRILIYDHSLQTGCMNGWMDGWLRGYLDEWIDGWIDGMHGCIVALTNG